MYLYKHTNKWAPLKTIRALTHTIDIALHMYRVYSALVATKGDGLTAISPVHCPELRTFVSPNKVAIYSFDICVLVDIWINVRKACNILNSIYLLIENLLKMTTHIVSAFLDCVFLFK